jgi:hypothetical protein
MTIGVNSEQRSVLAAVDSGADGGRASAAARTGMWLLLAVIAMIFATLRARAPRPRLTA